VIRRTKVVPVTATANGDTAIECGGGDGWLRIDRDGDGG